jgi:hypothetical protein
MTFHDKAALTDSLQEHNPPIHDSEFDRLLAILDASLDEVRRQEAIPIPRMRKRGIVRWWSK